MASAANEPSISSIIKDRPVLSSAPPPWHSVVVVAIMSAVFLALLPSWESLDEVASVEIFTNRVVFADSMSVRQLAMIRWFIAAQIWCVSLHTYFSDGWTQFTTYRPGTKLHSVPNKLVGIKTMFPFTSVSWNLLGLTFSLSGYIAWKASEASEDAPVDISPYMLRMAIICWEISAPFTLLVAAVIRYAIWPGVLNKGDDTGNLKSWRNVFMHNLNVLYAATELALLSCLPVRWGHVSLCGLVGTGYVIFSWLMSKSWNDTPKVGPQFIYFFFDTTMPGYTATIAILVLVCVQMVFYAIFASAVSLLTFLDGGVFLHVLFVLALCSCFMRFRD